MLRNFSYSSSGTLFIRYNPLNPSESLQDLLELTPKKDVVFIIEVWNAKVRSQEIPGVTGKFVLGVQNEAGQK